MPYPRDGYAAWAERQARDYAASKVKNGQWASEGAEARARTELMLKLPNGLDTPEHHLFAGLDGGVVVGHVWLHVPPLTAPGVPVKAWVYDLYVEAAHRGKGYGEAILRAGERRAHALGATTVGLHVYGSNTPARALYEKLGYVVTNVNMAKSLHDF